MPYSLSALYPDLAEAGGLSEALQLALGRAGSSLLVSRFDDGKGISPACYARVETSDRESQVFIAAQIRLFQFDFWSRKVLLATGKATDVDDVARAIDRWIGWGCGTADLAADFGFVEAKPDAWAFEQGVEVEHRWLDYLDGRSLPIPEMSPMIRAAADRPELRRLFPYTSHYSLGFSRCTGYPYTIDVPSIAPADEGHYRVHDRDRRDLWVGGLEEALDQIVAHLPPGCGPTVAGTAADLRQR